MKQISLFEEDIETIDLSDIQGIFNDTAKKTNMPADRFKAEKTAQGYSLSFDGKLFAKTDNSFSKIAAAEKDFTAVNVDIFGGKALNNPKGYMQIEPQASEVLSILSKLCEETIKNYIPEYRFGCCSRYVECSDAGCCTAPDKLHAKGCHYREHLENGRIFYGKNKNI